MDFLSTSLSKTPPLYSGGSSGGFLSGLSGIASAISPIAGAVTGIVGGISDLFSRNKAYKQQKKLLDYQYEKNLEMWNLQNEYNSPLAQRKRYEEAGLNPNLMYGQGNTGNASSPVQYGMASMAPWRGGVETAKSVVDNIMQLLNVKALIRKQNAEAASLEEDAANKRAQRRLTDATAGLRLKDTDLRALQIALAESTNKSKSNYWSAIADSAGYKANADFSKYNFEGLYNDALTNSVLDLVKSYVDLQKNNSKAAQKRLALMDSQIGLNLAGAALRADQHIFNEALIPYADANAGLSFLTNKLAYDWSNVDKITGSLGKAGPLVIGLLKLLRNAK